MTLGDKIRALRRAQDWTQDELGERIGVHGRHVSRYENNHLLPSKKTLQALARVFQLSIEELQGQKDASTPSIPDPELYEQFRAVCSLDEEDRNAVKRLLSVLITHRQMQQMLSSAS